MLPILAPLALVQVLDLVLRRRFYADLNGPSWSVVTTALVFDLLTLAGLSLWLRARGPAKAASSGAVGAVLVFLYALVTLASWGYYDEFQTLPGVFGATYILREQSDSWNLFVTSLTARSAALLVLAAASAFGYGLWLSRRLAKAAPPRPRGMKRVYAGAFVWVACLFVLRHNLAINPGTALPFTDGLYAVGTSLARQWSGTQPLVRLTERALAARAAPAGPTLPPAEMNGLLIVQESMRVQNLSAFGYARPTTPELERHLAAARARGDLVALFGRAYANATQTVVSVPSILAGHTGTDGFATLRAAPLFYEEMKRFAGMRTALIASHSYEVGNYKSYLKSPSLDFFFYRELGGDPAFNNVGADDRVVVRELKRFLDKLRPGERFFAVLHLNGSHYPYDVPPEFARFSAEAAGKPPREAQIAKYDDSIAFVDHVVGRALDELTRRGLADETLVAMTSDHGESFGEDGTRYHAGPFSEWNARVPALLVVPRRAAPGPDAAARWEASLAANARRLASNADIVPTLLDAFGVPHDAASYPGRTWLAPLPEGRVVCLSNGIVGDVPEAKLGLVAEAAAAVTSVPWSDAAARLKCAAGSLAR